ncbi:MFS transporter [Streptococcus salivarius]|uniref:MFS transporter n=1 Tax=Streptococcus salivarius TaxID=1304 RepID=UPI000A094815|nr:MFS transporter [Streptococcus salivarius]ARI60431.1 MFS transporter [Streptococcus salivarius]SQF76282.1 major facilitator family transporter [Streptococcus salivarius]
MKQKHSHFLIPGILLLGIVLRAPFTTLSTVLSDIASGLGVEVSSLGLLTSLPLLTFAIFSPFAARWAKRFGIERLFLGVLIVMTLGSALRTVNLPLLYAGTLLVGAGIAFINVLLPSLIQANEPNQLGFLTTLYITAMGLSTAVASSVAVPITKATSWQGLVWVLTAVCALALVVWLPNVRHNHYLEQDTSTSENSGSWYKSGKVWAIMIFGGLQSLFFYTTITWLPTMATQASVGEANAGILASVFTLTSIPFSMIVPSLITKLSDRNRHLMLVTTILAGLVGVAMLLVNTNSFVYWLVLNLLIGSSASVLFPYMMVVFSMKASSPEKTAQLSGLSQTGGYIFAALGPVLFGSSKQLFNSWTPAVLILLVLTLIMGIALYKVEKTDVIL